MFDVLLSSRLLGILSLGFDIRVLQNRKDSHAKARPSYGVLVSDALSWTTGKQPSAAMQLGTAFNSVHDRAVDQYGKNGDRRDLYRCMMALGRSGDWWHGRCICGGLKEWLDWGGRCGRALDLMWVCVGTRRPFVSMAGLETGQSSTKDYGQSDSGSCSELETETDPPLDRDRGVVAPAR